MKSFDAIDGNNCLIGHTGFVGGALLRQAPFPHRFNSSNIAHISGEHFGTVVCAAAPGSMFTANKAPDTDHAQIQALIEHLSTLKAERFVLISSIAVLADFAGGDDETTQAFQTELAYGRHRRELEAFVESHFPHSLIVRLPALFGRGLRKNFVFDLLNPVPSMLAPPKFDTLVGALDPALGQWMRALYHLNPITGMLVLDRAKLNAGPRRAALEDAIARLGGSATQFHHRDTTYQYYAIERLWADIGIALDAGLSHVHLVSEPRSAATIHRRLTGRAMPDTGARLHHEDMRTRHAQLWGGSGPYQTDAETTLSKLAAFYLTAKALV